MDFLKQSYNAESLLEGELLLIDKPMGWTSFQAVNKIRWHLKNETGLKKLKVHELHLEHCTLHYNMLEVFDHYDFRGILSCGVIDQRSDDIETVQLVHERIKPVVEKFGTEKILLSSECGFGHVPIEITRAKLGRLVEAAKKY